jgi:hypothetical protein
VRNQLKSRANAFVTAALVGAVFGSASGMHFESDCGRHFATARCGGRGGATERYPHRTRMNRYAGRNGQRRYKGRSDRLPALWGRC